jgi:hypothetical protein
VHIYSYLYNPKLSDGIIVTTLILATLRTAPRALRNRKRGAFGPGGRPNENSFFKKLQRRNKIREWPFSGRRMIRVIQKELRKMEKKAFIQVLVLEGGRRLES